MLLAIVANSLYFCPHTGTTPGLSLQQTYKSAGVDVAEGDRLVSRIRDVVRSTYSKRVLGEVGAFGAFYDARFKKYRFPVLVSSVDGVGTKLMLAHMLDQHETVGQDLVNHCVNDILVCGATPLFFMDYFATGKLRPGVVHSVIGGFVKACKENSCSLIGGETAEMPGFYRENEYDIAGTIVGVVEKKRIITGARVRKGDILIALPSTGLHTNGYSLARAVLLEKFGLRDYVSELGSRLADALMAVHRSYLGVVTAVLRKIKVHGLAHITGGGIVGNTMRVVPHGLHLNINWGAWERPPLFTLIQRVGNVPEDDMRRTFNLGVGLVMIVGQKRVDDVMRIIGKQGERAFIIGEVVSARGGR